MKDDITFQFRTHNALIPGIASSPQKSTNPEYSGYDPTIPEHRAHAIQKGVSALMRDSNLTYSQAWAAAKKHPDLKPFFDASAAADPARDFQAPGTAQLRSKLGIE